MNLHLVSLLCAVLEYVGAFPFSLSPTPNTGVEGRSRSMPVSPPVTDPGGAAETSWLWLLSLPARALEQSAPAPGPQVCSQKALGKSEVEKSSRLPMESMLTAGVPLCLTRVPGNTQRWWSSVLGQSHLEVYKSLPRDCETTLLVAGSRARVRPFPLGAMYACPPTAAILRAEPRQRITWQLEWPSADLSHWYLSVPLGVLAVLWVQFGPPQMLWVGRGFVGSAAHLCLHFLILVFPDVQRT